MWLTEEDEAKMDFPADIPKLIVKRYSLTVVYYSTGGNGWWTNVLGFLSNTIECNWNGVSPIDGLQIVVVSCSDDGYANSSYTNPDDNA
jgi:hypothetical protein